jgi:hypothetical protein
MRHRRHDHARDQASARARIGTSGAAHRAEVGDGWRAGGREGHPERLDRARIVGDVEVALIKLSDRRHLVQVRRADGTTDSVELDSRDFLRHDLAHFAVERELELRDGVWGSVAAGGSLSGDGLDGANMALAETVSGPMQTMMRTGADTAEIFDVLARVAPEVASIDLATRLHARLRSLSGHWASTPYGGEMKLEWPEKTPERLTFGCAYRGVAPGAGRR